MIQLEEGLLQKAQPQKIAPPARVGLLHGESSWERSPERVPDVISQGSRLRDHLCPSLLHTQLPGK